MRTEIESLAQLTDRLEHTPSLDGLILQGLDLSGIDLGGVDPRGGVLLGCRLDAVAAARLVAGGALVFPAFDELPYRPYRSRLYTPDELLTGWRPHSPGSFAADSLDSAIHGHAVAHRIVHEGELPLIEALARRLHDASIDDALGELLAGHERVVGIMGGHDLDRGAEEFAAVARLGRGLARRGALVLTGGGPGAMEAGNFGASSAHLDEQRFDEVLAELARGPGWRDPDAWLSTGLEARRRLGEELWPSLAVPTWFYGHEPTNVFATSVAKYFSNSLREDGLLAIATGGLIIAPGSAGTVQEIFQDAAQNHYPVRGVVSPMVLLGRGYWNEQLPALPLLDALSAGRPWGELLTAVDTIDEALDWLDRHPPRPA